MKYEYKKILTYINHIIIIYIVQHNQNEDKKKGFFTQGELLAKMLSLISVMNILVLDIVVPLTLYIYFLHFKNILEYILLKYIT